jgi:hypothetical protein
MELTRVGEQIVANEKVMSQLGVIIQQDD